MLSLSVFNSELKFVHGLMHFNTGGNERLELTNVVVRGCVSMVVTDQSGNPAPAIASSQ